MEYTAEHLAKFVRFHEAHAQARGAEPPVLDHEFARTHNLRRDDLTFIMHHKVQLEAAARDAGLIP